VERAPHYQVEWMCDHVSSTLIWMTNLLDHIKEGSSNYPDQVRDYLEICS